MNEPLSIEQLLDRRVDPTPLEIAYLAHALLVPERLTAFTRPRLSPAAAALRAMLVDLGGVVSAIGLAASAERFLWAFGAVFKYSVDEHTRAIAMAERVDVVTVAELAGLVPFEALASLLGSHPRQKPKKPAAWERQLEAAGVNAA